MIAIIQEFCRYTFMQLGLIASVLIGVSCGYLSVYVVLKRLVFLAVALAQFASAGIAVSLLVFPHSNPIIAAFIGVMLGSLFFSWPALGRYLPRENAIGTAYALTSAIGIILIANNASGEKHQLDWLYGDVLTARVNDLWIMAGIMLVAGVIFLCFAKEFLFTSFDAEMARTVGVRVKLWEVLFNFSLGLIIAMTIRLGGMMLAFAMLVLPGYAALIAGYRIRPAFLFAIILAVVSAVAGLCLTLKFDNLPNSALTIAALGLFVGLGAVIGMVKRLRRGARVNALKQTRTPIPCAEQEG